MIATLAVCALLGSGTFTAPDSGCTPGVRADGLTHQVACTPALHPRGPISSRLRRSIYERYGFAPGTFSGELDHRIPVFLLGQSVDANLWPESGPIPNPKDRLEFYVYRRVCYGKPHPMRPSTAVKIFIADWRVGYQRWVAP